MVTPITGTAADTSPSGILFALKNSPSNGGFFLIWALLFADKTVVFWIIGERRVFLRSKVILVLLVVLAFSILSNLPFSEIRIRLSYRNHLMGESILQSSKTEAQPQGVPGKMAASKIAESLRVLGATRVGNSLVHYLRVNSVAVRFGNMRTGGAAAVFVPLGPPANRGEIVVDPAYEVQSPAVLAAIIAHEVSHAMTYRPLSELSLLQELQAYRVQAEVWRELRVGFRSSFGPFALEVFESSPENDYALWVSRIKVSDALGNIKRDYRRLGIEAG